MNSFIIFILNTCVCVCLFYWLTHLSFSLEMALTFSDLFGLDFVFCFLNSNENKFHFENFYSQNEFILGYKLLRTRSTNPFLGEDINFHRIIILKWMIFSYLPCTEYLSQFGFYFFFALLLRESFHSLISLFMISSSSHLRVKSREITLPAQAASTN